PRKSDGSASALEFSRPPRRSQDYGLPARGVTCMTLSIVGFDGFVASTIAAIATGWSDPYRVGLPPTGEPCLCTAHRLAPPILCQCDWRTLFGVKYGCRSSPNDVSPGFGCTSNSRPG